MSSDLQARPQRSAVEIRPGVLRPEWSAAVSPGARAALARRRLRGPAWSRRKRVRWRPMRIGSGAPSAASTRHGDVHPGAIAATVGVAEDHARARLGRLRRRDL